MIEKAVVGFWVWPLFAVVFFYAVPVFSDTPRTDLKREQQSLVDVNLRFLQKKEAIKKATDDWGRDPFLLPSTPKNGVPVNRENRFLLSAIIYKNGSGAAIINNQITRKGDQVGGMAVHDIQPDRVILRSGSEVLELRVDPFTLR